MVFAMIDAYPSKLRDLLETFDEFSEPGARADLLISLADSFREVPPSIATRPFDKQHQIPQCESDAYAWATMNADGTLAFYFAVENPSGVSAKALAAILQRTLSGVPPEAIARISPELVERVFRQNLSMGKGLGLMSMVGAVQSLAARAARARTAPASAQDAPQDSATDERTDGPTSRDPRGRASSV
jgi:cysteine desulfuration protein SufE